MRPPWDAHSREILVNGIPLSVVPSASNADRLRVLPPPWDEGDQQMFLSLILVAAGASALCCGAWLHGVYNEDVHDDVLVPVQIIAAIFVGITIGFTVFTLTRTFYDPAEVLQAVRVAQRTQAIRVKKVLKSSFVDPKSRPTIPAALNSSKKSKRRASKQQRRQLLDGAFDSLQ